VTFAAGDTLTAALLNAVVSAVTPLFARKTANQTVNNSTTLVNDNELLVSIEANTTYEMLLHVRYDSSTVADMKINLTLPSGCNTPHMMFLGGGTGSAVQHAAAASPSFSTVDGQGVGTATAFDYVGTLVNGSNAGTVRFQFAQNTAEATNTTVQAGSTLRLTKVA
jgi:hypothetical protein